MVILYIAEIDGGRVRAAEVYTFNKSCRIVHGEAMYGAILESCNSGNGEHIVTTKGRSHAGAQTNL
jgi:hypothetical protein